VFWSFTRTLFSGIVLLYLQVLVMPGLAIGGLIPNLFLGWLVYQVWNKPINFLLPIVFILGLCYDLTMPTLLGLQTLLLVILAIGVDEFHRPLEKDSYITMLLTLGLAVLVYAILITVVYGVLSGFDLRLFVSFLGMILYNLVVSIVVAGIFFFISRLRLDIYHG